jgi:hypothetical protein
VYNERFECSLRTLYHGLFSLDEVKHVDTSGCVMLYSRSEPVSSCLDEFVRMKTCAFFSPAFALRYGTHMVVQMFVYIFCISAPIDDLGSPFDIDRSWLAVKAESLPVPKFEGEQIRSRTDF